jgi:hypothetical protein
MAELMVSTYGQRGLDLEAQTVESRLMADFVPIGSAAENGLLWLEPAVFQQGIEFEVATGGIEAARSRGRRRDAGADRRGPAPCLSVPVLSGQTPRSATTRAAGRRPRVACPMAAGHRGCRPRPAPRPTR